MTTEEGTDDQQGQRSFQSPRYRIKLSTRDVDMDTGESINSSFSSASQQQLSQHLNSTIGMGVAIDPMAAAAPGNLIFKHDQRSLAGRSGSGALINGYALVGDTEGEPDVPPPASTSVSQPIGRGRGSTLPAWMTRGDDDRLGNNSTKAANDGASSLNKPMGRGRGTTLPAWMTRDTGTSDAAAHSDAESRSGDRHTKKERKERKKHSRKRSRDTGRRRHDHHSRKHRHRRRQRNEETSNGRQESPRTASVSSDNSYSSTDGQRYRSRHHDRDGNNDGRRRERKRHRRSSREESRSPSFSSESDREKKRHRKHKHHHSRRRHGYSDDEGSRRGRDKASRVENNGSVSDKNESYDGRNARGSSTTSFSSVAEAKRLIAELEDKKRHRER